MTSAVAPSATRRPFAPGVVAASCAVAWTLLALVVFAVAPMSSSETSSSSSDGTVTTNSEQSTLVESEGVGVLVVLLVPVAVSFAALAAVAFRMRALTGGLAVVALGLCLVSMLSIGFFYLPAAVLLLVAAVRSLVMPGPTP